MISISWSIPKSVLETDHCGHMLIILITGEVSHFIVLHHVASYVHLQRKKIPGVHIEESSNSGQE